MKRIVATLVTYEIVEVRVPDHVPNAVASAHLELAYTTDGFDSRVLDDHEIRHITVSPD